MHTKCTFSLQFAEYTFKKCSITFSALPIFLAQTVALNKMCLLWSWHFLSSQQLADTVWVGSAGSLVYMNSLLWIRAILFFVSQMAVKPPE
jgi:hypothetical protein